MATEGGKAILISNKNVFVWIKNTQGPTTQFESNWVTSRQTHPHLRCFRGTSTCISGYLREVRDIGEVYGITMAGWWHTYPSEKYYIVSWEIYSQYMEEWKLFQTSDQHIIWNKSHDMVNDPMINHILWMARNHPESLETSCGMMMGYHKGIELWEILSN